MPSGYVLLVRFEVGLEDQAALLCERSKAMRHAAEVAMFQRPLEVELSVTWKRRKRLYWYVVGFLDGLGLDTQNLTDDGNGEAEVLQVRRVPDDDATPEDRSAAPT